MSEIKIITDKPEWDSLVDKFDNSDFYHTYEYHVISKNEDEKAMILAYSDNDVKIALPLVIRVIPGTDFKDATSVYGYSGPLVKNIPDAYDNSDFVSRLNQVFSDQNIVSVFSRLHPYVSGQEQVLNGLGDVNFHGNVVNIDLTEPVEVQRAKYNRRLKSYVNKARKQCRLKIAETDEEILEYIDIYYENMKRVNASKGYFFDKEYFYQLINANDFHKDIYLAIDNDSGKIAAGVMFVKKNNIVQYHLSGIREEFMHLNPIKMLIDEMRLVATAEGFKFFNLGGGLGAKDDSLFHFKSLFSKDFREFKLWKYVIDQEAYDNLVQMVLKRDNRDFEDLNPEFFPAYRA